MERLIARINKLSEKIDERNVGMKFSDVATTELRNEMRTNLRELIDIVKTLALGLNDIGKKVT